MLKNRLVQIIMIILAGIGLIWGINAVLIINVTGESIQTSLTEVHPESPVHSDPSGRLSSHCNISGIESLILIYEQPGIPPIFQFVFIDFDLPALSVLNIPGNLIVKSQILPQSAIQPVSLDAAYSELKMQNQNRHGVVAALLAQILFENLNITADHYVILQSQAYRQLAEMLGGVWMDIPYPMPVPGSTLVLEPGTTILTAEFVQQMALWSPTGHPEADQLAMERVMLLTRGIAAQMEANGGDHLRPMVLDTLGTSIQTDMKAERFSCIFCAVGWIPDYAIQLSAPHADWFSTHMMNR